MNILQELKDICGANRNIVQRNDVDIDTWYRWYCGFDQSFHQYKIYNGIDYIERTRARLFMAKEISERWGGLISNEHTTITYPDATKDAITPLLEEQNFETKYNINNELAFALGQNAMTLTIKGMMIQEGVLVGKGKGIDIVNVDNRNIYPITEENGEYTECAFYAEDSNEKRLIAHLKNEDGNYEIITRTWKYKNGNWERVNKDFTFRTLSDKPLFFIFKPNKVNPSDLNGAAGASIYAQAIDILKAVDEKYDSLQLEFENGKSRIFASTDLVTLDVLYKDGKAERREVFDKKDVSFYALPKDEMDKNKILHDTPTLRVQEHIAALNAELAKLGEKCGFGKDFFVFSNESSTRPIQTATGVYANNSELFRNVKRHEILQANVLKKLLDSFIYYSNAFTTNAIPPCSIKEIKIDFDDSIFEDTESNKENARKDVAIGVMSKEQYRAEFYGEKEEDANKNLYSNPEYVAQMVNQFLPALQSKAISAKDFVQFCYGKDDAELVKKIESSQSIDAETLLSQFGNA